MDLAVLIFLLVYIALAFGHLPGFKVDRTGAAVIGAMAMMATERIGPQAAWDAIDYRTVGLLLINRRIACEDFNGLDETFQGCSKRTSYRHLI